MSFAKKKFTDFFSVPFSERSPDGSTSRTFKYFSLPSLEQHGIGNVSRLPVCIKIILESLLRHRGEADIGEETIFNLANWNPKEERTREIPFKVARVLLQDFTGVPLGVDLAAMRSAAEKMKANPKVVEPLVPVDLVIDHSVQVDVSSSKSALKQNLNIEFERNYQRYKFLKWCQQSFNSFRVVPPGIGICHQVNLEYLAGGILIENNVVYPDSLVGTDSHTTMINGLGVVGWGVGGIEAEAAMLGQPVYILTPDVVGVELTGTLKEGVTATDMVLKVTELLRGTNVVGKFVEFHGDGAMNLSVQDRATISNMSPEYGATMGYFPVDDKTCEYMLATGRPVEHVNIFKRYYEAQGMFGIPKAGQIAYTKTLKLDISTILPAVAGPKRPQDRIELTDLKSQFDKLLDTPKTEGGFEISKDDKDTTVSVSLEKEEIELTHGDILIAAITSCTNTSNPSVMIAAGLLAKKAVEKGLTIKESVKTSLAPGSRVVSEYLENTGLQEYLDKIGFHVVGYGCTTCIGNSGPLNSKVEEAVVDKNLVGASVLSGNRNFEARVHQNVKANFLMSPPLVVAFAIAGTVDINLKEEPLAKDKDGNDVYLKDIWPNHKEISELLYAALDPKTYTDLYNNTNIDENWDKIPQDSSVTYPWEDDSTYIQHPPYFENFGATPEAISDIVDARVLGLFGDSVTTDHISPAGAIKSTSPAGRYLKDQGVDIADFNSYGSRRGNHEVMIRGTFANVRIKNLLVPGTEGGVTKLLPEGEVMDIYDASQKYLERDTPLVVIAGKEYGTGSSRDWAAKGTILLGVKAVIAESFERIHRSNLIGMGVLPLQFLEGQGRESLKLTGEETFSIRGLANGLKPQQHISVEICYANNEKKTIEVLSRIDTPVEKDYFLHGGILPYVLRQLIASDNSDEK